MELRPLVMELGPLLMDMLKKVSGRTWRSGEFYREGHYANDLIWQDLCTQSMHM